MQEITLDRLAEIFYEMCIFEDMDFWHFVEMHKNMYRVV